MFEELGPEVRRLAHVFFPAVQFSSVQFSSVLGSRRVLWTRCETPMAVLANMTPGPSSLHARSNRDILTLAVPLAALDIDWIWFGIVSGGAA